MKTLKLIAVGIILLVSSSIQAQVVNVNLGSPPAWAPAGQAKTDYYYLPDVETYYDVRAKQFIYFGDGKWIRSRSLPRQHRGYNLYNGYKVVLNDYHGPAPYTYYKKHKVKYYKGYKGSPQRSIGVRHDSRGENNGNHKNHGNHGNNGNKGHKGGGNGNNGNGHGKGKH